jgi:hypothetical protein
LDFVTKAHKYHRTLPDRIEITKPLYHDSLQILPDLSQLSEGDPPPYFFQLCAEWITTRTLNLSIFRDDSFLTLLKIALKSSSDSSVNISLRFICLLWYRLPLPINLTDPLISFDLAELVFDCLHFVNPTVSFTALNCLANFAALSPPFCLYLLEKNLLFFLTRWFQSATTCDRFEPALRLLQTLVSEGVDGTLFHEMKQLLPVMKTHLLGSSWPYIRKHALIILIPFLENESGFQYARQLELHADLSKCAFNLIDCDYGYYLFRAIALFVRRGFLRVFAGKFIFIGLTAFFAVERTGDISSVFYVMAGLTERFWLEFWKEQWVWKAIEYGKQGAFENRIGAAFFVNQMMRFSHVEMKDQIGNQGGFEVICMAFECFDDRELGFVTDVVLEMMELNVRLYGPIFTENVSREAIEEMIDGIKPGEIVIEKLELIRDRILATTVELSGECG